MTNHSDDCRQCRQRLLELLTALFGEVSTSYDLELPARLHEYRFFPLFHSLREIHEALQSYCGYAGFMITDRLPVVSYFVHNPGFVVEFDEPRRFTLPRAISLAYYPADLQLGFARTRWVHLARTRNFSDDEQAYHAEQLAWYDTLYDFSSAILNHKPTVRLCASDQRWCALDPTDEQHLQAFHQLLIPEATN